MGHRRLRRNRHRGQGVSSLSEEVRVMSIPLRQSTQVIIPIGPFLDKTDGVTEETGLVGVATEICKADGSFAAGPVLGTHDAEGWYPITLTTTHTNTLGSLAIKVHDSATHLPVWERFHVIPAHAFDSLYDAAGTDYLPVDVIQLGSVSQSGTDLKDFADTGYDPTAHKVAGVVTVDTTTTNTDMLTAAAVN